jgi:hypothetical protein
MKSIFMICLLFLSASLSAMPETPAEKATQQLAEYGKAFTLTSEQKAAATPVLKEYYTKRAEVKANKDITKKAEEEKIDILKAKRDKQLRTIFGSENWKNWEDYKAKQKAADKAAKAQQKEQE